MGKQATAFAQHPNKMHADAYNLPGKKRQKKASKQRGTFGTMMGNMNAWLVLPLNEVLVRLDDPDSNVRAMALATLGRHGNMEPATLAQHADAVIARLEVDEGYVRGYAVIALRELEPVTLAQHANAVVARLDDSNQSVRYAAVSTLGKLEPATLAQHANAVVARLEDSAESVRRLALETMGELEPMTLAHHANAVIARLEDSSEVVRNTALATLTALPLVVTQDVDLKSSEVRSRLLGRLAWYNYRLHARVKRIALYWYALPYRPSGPGHTREVEAWRRMQELRLS